MTEKVVVTDIGYITALYQGARTHLQQARSLLLDLALKYMNHTPQETGNRVCNYIDLSKNLDEIADTIGQFNKVFGQISMYEKCTDKTGTSKEVVEGAEQLFAGVTRVLEDMIETLTEKNNEDLRY